VALSIPFKAILDLVGVAALVPMMMLVLEHDPSSDASVPSVLFGLSATQLCIGVIVFLLLKSFISILIVRYQNSWLLSLYRHFSGALFTNLYSKGLLFIKQSNTSEMTFNVNAVCYNFVLSYLGGWMQLVGETVFVLLMIVALVIYSPLAALLAVVSFIPAVAVYLLAVSKPLSEYGKAGNKARRAQYRQVQETFRGYPEIEVGGAFPQIKERFDSGLDEISDKQIKSTMLRSVPSYMLEIVIALIIGVLLLFSVNSDGGNVLFLGVLAVAMLRLMPAVRAIIGSWGAIKATRYTLEIVSQIEDESSYNEEEGALGAGSDESVLPLGFCDRISVRDVSFSFGDESVLDNISFDVLKGERVGFRGRTGAGKTTLFNLLLGLYAPAEGTITIDGKPLKGRNITAWHKTVGYVPQDVFISDSTLLENVALGQSPERIDRERVLKALEQASLKEFVDSLPDGVDSRIGEAGSRISGGQRQRLGIARALYKGAEVLFFDEATSSLDNATELEVNRAIEDLAGDSNLTVLVIAHRDSTLAFCDRVIDL
jgi:ABC-type multidrug transport system, ATPase and permease components